MTAAVIRFPSRQVGAVFVLREEAAWLVLLRSHGWLFGSRRDALVEARELAAMAGLCIVERVS
ncbi:MAG: hypothetical protein GEU91_13590 [Rhizobiales bacterium]|nr:hypothetical protein [Hyphomicrobiales bacterium]